MHEDAPARRRRPRDAILGVGALAVVLTAAGVELDRLGKGRTFFYDEWDFVLGRRGGLTDALLQPHNGHLSLVPVGAYRIMFAAVGLDHYRPYRLIAILVHLLVAALVAALVRRSAGWGIAVPMGAAVAWLGSAWQDTLWPFQIGFMGSVAAGLAAHLCLASRRRDPLAAALLGVALACSSLGLPLAFGAACRLACRRDDWPRWWLVAAPTASWFAWYLAYGGSQASGDNLPLLGGYVATSAAGAVAALGNLDLDWGRLLAGIGIGVWAATIARDRRCPPLAVGWAATGLSFWLLTGISRAKDGEPAASRYVYLGAIVVLLLVAEYLPRFPPRRALVAVWLVLALGIWGNISVLRAGAVGLRSTSEIVGAELFAVELAAKHVAPDYRPDATLAPPVFARSYLNAVADLGSPASSETTVARSSETARLEVDRVLLEIYRPSVEAVPSAATASVGCERVAVGQETLFPAGGAVLLPDPGVRLSVHLRRFADAPGTEPVLTAGENSDLRLPNDNSSRPWRVLVVGGSGRVCPVG